MNATASAGWPSAPHLVARIAALEGGCWLGAERVDELADMVVEVIAGCARSSPPLPAPSSSSPKGDPKPARKPCVSSRKSTVRCDGSLVRVRSEEHPLGGAGGVESRKDVTPAVCRSRDGSGAFRRHLTP